MTRSKRLAAVAETGSHDTELPDATEHAGRREYRIDELARLGSTTVRNVRAYQDRGLLPSPRRQGRVGLYSDVHLARLRLVAALLERGYTLSNIAELLGAWERGQDLGDLLGFEVALVTPWSDEHQAVVSPSELRRWLGDLDERSAAEALLEAVRLGIVVPVGESFRIVSPEMLETGRLLVEAGVPLQAVAGLAEQMQQSIDGVARGFVDLVATQVIDRLGVPLPADAVPELASLVQQLRPLAKRVVEAELSRAMDRRIQQRLGEQIGRLGPRSGAAPPFRASTASP